MIQRCGCREDPVGRFIFRFEQVDAVDLVIVRTHEQLLDSVKPHVPTDWAFGHHSVNDLPVLQGSHVDLPILAGKRHQFLVHQRLRRNRLFRLPRVKIAAHAWL